MIRAQGLLLVVLALGLSFSGGAIGDDDLEVEELTLKPDGPVDLRAFYYPPKDRKRNSVLFVHDTSGDLSPFDPLIGVMHRAGFQILGMELRGHGQSVSEDYDWAEMDEEERSRQFPFLRRDFDAGMDALMEYTPTGSMVVVGLGAGAVIAASGLSNYDEVEFLVLIDPPAEETYLGRDFQADLSEAERPTLFVGSKSRRQELRTFAEQVFGEDQTLITVETPRRDPRNFEEMTRAEAQADLIDSLKARIRNWVEDQIDPPEESTGRG